MNKIYLIIFFLLTLQLSAQKSAWSKLGTAEKFWVVTHPFSVKKAYRLSQHTLGILDSLEKKKYFENNTKSGSKADALRHCYWMSLLSAHIGPKRALWLGRAHEKKNKKDFEKGRLEEGYLPDSVSITMDLRNNELGSKVGTGCKVCDYDQLLTLSIRELKKGSLLYVKQNKKGDFLSQSGEVIPNREWNGKWQNSRILIPTSYSIGQSQN